MPFQYLMRYAERCTTQGAAWGLEKWVLLVSYSDLRRDDKTHIVLPAVLLYVINIYSNLALSLLCYTS